MSEESWRIEETSSLSSAEIETVVSHNFNVGQSLIMICRGERWLPFGEINELNRKEAEVCIKALNDAGI